MKIYFLGTGTSQGIPVIGSKHSVCLSSDSKDKRLRVSVWIETEDASIVIDCGPDFRQQMLTSKCERIDALLFTHEHADHTAGLDDIRPFYFQQGDISVYAHQRVLTNLAKRFDYIFETENKYPGAPSVSTNKVVKNESFFVKNTAIIPIDALHGNLQIFGYKIQDFVYLTDVKTMSEEDFTFQTKQTSQEILDKKDTILEMLDDENYYTENGDLNISKITKDLNTSRATVMSVLNGE